MELALLHMIISSELQHTSQSNNSPLFIYNAVWATPSNASIHSIQSKMALDFLNLFLAVVENRSTYPKNRTTEVATRTFAANDYIAFYSLGFVVSGDAIDFLKTWEG